MINYTCPTPDRWTALLGDELSADEQLDMQSHLDNCPECQRVLETCAADRAAWAAVPRWLGSCSDADAKLRTVIERLKHSPDDSTSDTDMTLDFLDPSERADSLGRLNSYEIIEEIGRGGMGIVLKALDPALHRVVAIKVLAPQLAVSGSARKRFTREARAAAAVCHEHVVTIHAVEEFKTLPYLVMHYVAGQSLQQKLNSHGPLPVADILRIGTQAAAGLAAAHAQGLVHRDVKPANILLENGVERVRLTDFGLARAIDDVGVTQSGVITGTPQYMAPEQARGEPLDARADLFSLGSVLYAMCTGEAPFDGSHALDVLRKVGEEQPQPIRDVNYEIPEWLEAIVVKLMAKDPSRRFGSAAEVAELLEQCLAHVQNPSAEPLPPNFGQRPRRSRWEWAAIVLPILAGLFVVSEGTGATHIMKSLGTILRFRTPEGTLVVEVDDPTVKVTLDDKDLVIAGAGAQEVRLKVGSHTLRAAKDGQTKTEIVSIEKDGKVTVKVSFEATPQPPPTQAAAEKRWTIEFRDKPWGQVFDWLGEISGLPVIANTKPTGTFTFAPAVAGGKPRQYTLNEIFDIFNDALLQKNFLLVRRPNNFVLAPTDEKIDPRYYRRITLDELPKCAKTELVSMEYKLGRLQSADVRPALDKMLSQFGMAQTVRPPGTLSIRDMAANVQALVRMLDELGNGPPAGAFQREPKPAPSGNPTLGEGKAGSEPVRPRDPNDPRFSASFPRESWPDFFDRLSRLSGLPVVATIKPEGNFFGITPPPLQNGQPLEYTLDDLLDTVNSMLSRERFFLARRPDRIELFPTDKKLDPAKFTSVSMDELAKRRKTDLVALDFQLKYTVAAYAAEFLKTFHGPLGSSSGTNRTNRVLVRDTAERVLSIVHVLTELERKTKEGGINRNSEPAAPGDPTLSGGNGAAATKKAAGFGILAANAPLALLGYDEGAEIWDVAASQSRFKLKFRWLSGDGHEKPPTPKVAISADGKLAAYGVGDTLVICDTMTGKRLKDATTHAGEITAVAFGAKGKLVATAGAKDAQVKVWDVGTNKEIRTFARFMIPVSVLAFSPDGSKLLMSDGTIVRVYDLVTGAEIDDRIPIGAQVSTAAFTADGQIVALAGRTILVWKPEKDAKVQKFDAGIDLTALALTPDRRRVLVGKSSGEVELWDLSKGQYVWAFAGYGPHPVRALSVAPDGRSYTLIGASPDGSMVIRTESANLADTGQPPPEETINRR